MTTGIAYGVGVGPGDPELMTLKAIRILRENEVIAVPGKDPKQTAAYQIAVQALPALAEKKLVPLPMPMTKDAELLRQAHRKGADLIEEYLKQGRNVVFLTIGDPTVYCTFGYLQQLLEADGYPVALVSGVPSFCAAAARLQLPLAEWDEPLHILPAVFAEENPLQERGTYVLMKSGGRMKRVKDYLRESGRPVRAVQRCGMPDEACYADVEEIPDDAGYFTLIIAKEKP